MFSRISLQLLWKIDIIQISKFLEKVYRIESAMEIYFLFHFPPD